MARCAKCGKEVVAGIVLCSQCYEEGAGTGPIPVTTEDLQKQVNKLEEYGFVCSSQLKRSIKLRPCMVKVGKKEERKALFHRWADRAEVVGESLLRGGHPSGQLWLTFGIVEMEDGTVIETYPSQIRFLDKQV